jgi:acyl phosphate:glycerol-3-phosphate acyltransferase
MTTGHEFAAILAGYCLGCVTAGYYLVRWRTGRDVRCEGSGSTGATNVARVLGRPGFLGTLAVDAGKGALAVWIASKLDVSAVTPALIGAVIGHTWPAQLRFRGGKGVATCLGGLLLYDWQLIGVLGAMVLPLYALLRRFTISGLIAFILLPPAMLLMGRNGMDVGGVSILVLIILLAHRKNLREEWERIRGRASSPSGPMSTQRKHESNSRASI